MNRKQLFKWQINSTEVLIFNIMYSVLIIIRVRS